MIYPKELVYSVSKRTHQGFVQITKNTPDDKAAFLKRSEILLKDATLNPHDYIVTSDLK